MVWNIDFDNKKIYINDVLVYDDAVDKQNTHKVDHNCMVSVNHIFDNLKNYIYNIKESINKSIGQLTDKLKQD